MHTVAKNKLKAKMLAYFREVEKTGVELIVTDNKKPVIRILPYAMPATLKTLFADTKGKMTYSEPLDAPTDAEWGDVS